jgi:curved DNA-binding protein CbpA
VSENPRPGGAERAPSALTLAAWLDEGRRGIVEVRTAGGGCRLHLADGVLRLAAGDPIGGGGTGPVQSLEPLIALLGSAAAEDLRFTPSSVMTPSGRPLPTARLLMEAAARGRDRHQLWSQIGGRSVLLRMTGESALSEEALGGIEPRLQPLLSRFVRARRAAELVDEGTEGLETLRDLARLRAVGLLAPAPSEGDGARTALSKRSKELFVRRIAREIERRPLRLNRDEHRRLVVELVRSLGVSNHYELLRVGRHQDEQAIHQAYVDLASLAHPSHAARIGLEGKSAPLDLLFEAATEAYLVLSHPDRRRDYDRELGADTVGPASAERRREKAGVAREMYARARHMALEEDMQAVLELMRQAVQLDPQADYYKLLGDVQRRNPLWKAGALASYRDAVRCRPDDPALRLAFARALEEGGDRTQAGIQYRAALELRPHDVELLEALENFESEPSRRKRKKPKKDRGRDADGDEADSRGDGGGGGLFPTLRRLFRRGGGAASGRGKR